MASFDVSSTAEADETADGTLIIFDWDDTILPTTWLMAQGLQVGSQPGAEQHDCLRAVAASASNAMRAAKQLGKVVVVTMADAGWVELTGTHFLPLLAPV